MNNLKKVSSLTILTALLVGVFGTSALASNNDNYGYSGVIKQYQANTQFPKGFERETTDNNNAWKVNFQKTTEGNSDSGITTYWIELHSGTNVSAGHNVASGSGAHFYAAYDDADLNTVFLTAEDNNYLGGGYSVSGVWDEETGMLPD